MAKVVADHFDDSQHPLLIASTAHYAKFGRSVLGALGQAVAKEDMSGLFQRMEKLEGLDLPKMHEVLKEGVLRPRVHKTVTKPNIKYIVEELKNFVTRN